MLTLRSTSTLSLHLCTRCPNKKQLPLHSSVSGRPSSPSAPTFKPTTSNCPSSRSQRCIPHRPNHRAARLLRQSQEPRNHTRPPRSTAMRPPAVDRTDPVKRILDPTSTSEKEGKTPSST
ncbi:hypothetical protein JCM11641_007642 [Rhodosporidiobolus odoratus]